MQLTEPLSAALCLWAGGILQDPAEIILNKTCHLQLQSAFPIPSTKHSVLLPTTCITIMRISADGLNRFVLHLYFSFCPAWDMADKQKDFLFCTTPWTNSKCSVCLCVSPSLCSKKWQLSEYPGRSSPLAQTGYFCAHQHSAECVLQGLLIFCWLFPALCWFSFLPPARLFLVPEARRNSNFLTWSCKLGEGNTTTFRGLVEEQLEVQMGCLQAWLQETFTFTFSPHYSAPGGFYLFPTPAAPHLSWSLCSNALPGTI